MRRDAERIVRDVVAAVSPERLVAREWDEIEGILGREPYKPTIDLIAIGKASAGMALAVLTRMDAGSTLRRGLVLAPEGADCDRETLRERWPVIAVRTVDHPIPTARNVRAAEEAERLASSKGGDILVVLISGGGSAHLTLPAEGVTLADISDVSQRLMRAGADIRELNTVRKHLERLKGGGLAAGATRGGYAHVVSLVMSDVVGDDLSVIASGPLTPDPTTYRDAMRVLGGRHVASQDVPGVWRHLERGTSGAIAETPKPGDRTFARVQQKIIGSNADAVRSAAISLNAAGVVVIETKVGVCGEASDVARQMVAEAERAGRARDSIAIVWGGETTVRVGEERGNGGRNQEFVLEAARRLDASGLRDRLAVLSFATDGVDGPTDACGACATGHTWGDIAATGIDPAASLAGHDSHGALDAARMLIRTGPTGTNVNDVMAAIAYTEERQ